MIPGTVGRSIHWTTGVGSLSAVLLVDGVFFSLHAIASLKLYLLNYFICWLISECGNIGYQKKQAVEYYPHESTKTLVSYTYENDMSEFQLNHQIGFVSYIVLEILFRLLYEPAMSRILLA